jgi:hypothetical protein
MREGDPKREPARASGKPLEERSGAANEKTEKVSEDKDEKPHDEIVSRCFTHLGSDPAFPEHGVGR